MNTISWQRCDTLLLLFLVFLFHFLRQSLLQPCQVELASTIQEKQWVPPIMPFLGPFFTGGVFFVAKDVDSNIWYWYRCICKDVYMEGKYIVIICIRLYFAHDLLLPLKFEMSVQMFLQVFCQCPGDCDSLYFYDIMFVDWVSFCVTIFQICICPILSCLPSRCTSRSGSRDRFGCFVIGERQFT